MTAQENRKSRTDVTRRSAMCAEEAPHRRQGDAILEGAGAQPPPALFVDGREHAVAGHLLGRANHAPDTARLTRLDPRRESTRDPGTAREAIAGHACVHKIQG